MLSSIHSYTLSQLPLHGCFYLNMKHFFNQRISLYKLVLNNSISPFLSFISLFSFTLVSWDSYTLPDIQSAWKSRGVSALSSLHHYICFLGCFTNRLHPKLLLQFAAGWDFCAVTKVFATNHWPWLLLFWKALTYDIAIVPSHTNFCWTS